MFILNISLGCKTYCVLFTVFKFGVLLSPPLVFDEDPHLYFSAQLNDPSADERRMTRGSCNAWGTIDSRTLKRDNKITDFTIESFDRYARERFAQYPL